MTTEPAHESPETIRARLLAISPSYGPTYMMELPPLAAAVGVSRIYAKDEGQRTLGSFKSLGGTYAGLRALAHASGIEIDELIRDRDRSRLLPDLITASAGNHGLAVAAAARFAGSRARIYLYPGVSRARRLRIVEMGGEIIDIEGTYDDAVAAAKKASGSGAGILVADTSEDPSDPIVADVMAGYGVVPYEIRQQLDGIDRPTHVFVQAGVGGLAAAMSTGLQAWLASPARIIVVEPDRAASVELALKNGRVERFVGSLDTSATMLACGEASDPALKILAGTTEVVTVSEDTLQAAPRRLYECGGPDTTPSGAAGVAGLITAMADHTLASRFELGPSSRVLLVITEGPLHEKQKRGMT
jgi:diaminopropionate ammonia-lyase